MLSRETLGCIDLRNHIWLSGSQTVTYKEVYGDYDADEWKFGVDFFFSYILHEAKSY